MQLHLPLRVITPTVDGDVLVALARADEEFTGRGLHRVVGRRSKDGIRLALERLVAQGIVLSRRAGAAKLYRLNRDHLAAPHIIALARMRDEFIERLRDRLASWERPARYAALFGSAARGEMSADSDIDLLFVRPDAVGEEDRVWTGQLAAVARAATDWAGNDTRPLELSEAEVRERIEAADPLLAEVVDAGVAIAGSPDYLRRIQRRLGTGVSAWRNGDATEGRPTDA